MPTIPFFDFLFPEIPRNFQDFREIRDPLSPNKHGLIERRAQLGSGQPSRISAKAVF